MLNRLLKKNSILWDRFLAENIFVRRLYLLLAEILRMPYKQFYVNLDQVFLDNLKEKSAISERRSVNSLARKLFDDLPKHRGLLLEFGDYLKQKELKISQATKSVGLTFRITEDEIWDWKEKALLARMNPRELTINLLELWYSGELEPILQSLGEKFDLNKGEDVIKRVS